MTLSPEFFRIGFIILSVVYVKGLWYTKFPIPFQYIRSRLTQYYFKYIQLIFILMWGLVESIIQYKYSSNYNTKKSKQTAISLKEQKKQTSLAIIEQIAPYLQYILLTVSLLRVIGWLLYMSAEVQFSASNPGNGDFEVDSSGNASPNNVSPNNGDFEVDSSIHDLIENQNPIVGGGASTKANLVLALTPETDNTAITLGVSTSPVPVVETKVDLDSIEPASCSVEHPVE